jgi:glycosyltransferase involved in cell wall biosynthesis
MQRPRLATSLYHRLKIRVVSALLPPRIGRFRQYAARPMRIPTTYVEHQVSPSSLRISIVVPSYNQAGYLRTTLDSVLGQKYSNLELIVQDGGSTDESQAVLREYSHHLKHWESRRDGGQAHAINLGFRHATGEILAYLNSDDVLLPGALAYVSDFFARNPEVDAVYGHRIVIDESGMEVGRWVLPAHDDNILKWADFVPQETLFWRRRIWDAAGGAMDETFRFALDWDLLTRFIEKKARLVRLPRFLGGFRVHQGQKTTSDFDTIGKAEMRRLRERVHGRTVSAAEIRLAVWPYLLRSVALHSLYRLGVLHY